MNVAQAMVQGFIQEGVQVAAGISGASIRETADALCGSPKIRVCYARHERGAVDIADGYGRVTGEPAVVFTDAGPAVANTMGGIANSFGDSTPLVFVAAQLDRPRLGRRYTKELAIQEMFGPVSKWTTTIDGPPRVAEVVRRAFTLLRSGRPGPVVIELPIDVSKLPVAGFDYEGATGRVRSAGDPAEVERAVRLLAAAERPYVYVGAGVLFSQASAALVALAELLSLPVATTLNGKSAFPENHPLALGIGGFPRAMYGTRPATEYARQADVILTIGCSFQQHATYGSVPGSVKLIQVDVDPLEINKLRRADVAIVGDARLVLQQMVAAARSAVPAARLGARPEVAQAVAQARAEWLAFSKPLLTSEERPINPFRVTWELKQLVDPSQTIVLHDAGSTRGAVCQHYEATTPRSFLGMGVQSAMGWAIGGGIGAKLAAPEKLVVSFIGDEAFGETAMEIETAVRSELPILVVLMNNRGAAGDGSSLPHVSMVQEFGVAGDYCALARALGAEARRIADPNAVASGLAEAIRTVQNGRVTVVEVITNRVETKLYE